MWMTDDNGDDNEGQEMNWLYAANPSGSGTHLGNNPVAFFTAAAPDARKIFAIFRWPEGPCLGDQKAERRWGQNTSMAVIE